MDAHRSIFPLLYPLTTHSGWLRWIWNGWTAYIINSRHKVENRSI
jgi:hypothetical protein